MSRHRPPQPITRTSDPRGQFTKEHPVAGQFNKFAAGDKHYGGGRNFPNQGKTTNKVGYGVRDKKREAAAEAFKRHGGK